MERKKRSAEEDSVVTRPEISEALLLHLSSLDILPWKAMDRYSHVETSLGKGGELFTEELTARRTKGSQLDWHVRRNEREREGGRGGERQMLTL